MTPNLKLTKYRIPFSHTTQKILPNYGGNAGTQQSTVYFLKIILHNNMKYSHIVIVIICLRCQATSISFLSSAVQVPATFSPQLLKLVLAMQLISQSINPSDLWPKVPEILSQSLICFHWATLSENPIKMHCWIILNTPIYYLGLIFYVHIKSPNPKNPEGPTRQAPNPINWKPRPQIPNIRPQFQYPQPPYPCHNPGKKYSWQFGIIYFQLQLPIFTNLV